MTVEIALPRRDDNEGEDEVEKEHYSYLMSLKESLAARMTDLEAPVLDQRDEGTADEGILRHKELIRLTGKHPLNAEPPLDVLMKHGFITPAPLHYVRNHGHVPKATWDSWEIEVSGLVRHEMRLTMADIVTGLTFPQVEFPVTITCSGNRRKELNMIKKTVGFNWGSGAISTAIWRGIPLRNVLLSCGVKRRHGLHVWFEGEEDLPAGGGTKYATSIKLEMAMDPSRDILLAFMMNGERLPPDHGFPVRMILPGFTGGRMVKWVRRIIVTDKENDSYYHYKDNRVLPPNVLNSDIADAEGWWYKPEYIINEINTNSVITTPSNDETIQINSSTTQKPYVMKGYAFSGGGKKVTRVEVTFDEGESWMVCNIDYPEKPNEYGKHWCWCFWSLEVEILDLVGAKEVAVRAWDETHGTQPKEPIWNLVGMMNNSWFRLKVHVSRPKKGEIGLVFEQPIQPGNVTGGWMARNKYSSLRSRTIKRTNSHPSLNLLNNTRYTMKDVEKHRSRESTWIIVHGNVYDCTPFLNDHPGGADSILTNAGIDCTEEFDAIHSDKAKLMLDKYYIGEFVTVAVADTNSSSSSITNLAQLNDATSSPPPPSNDVPTTLVPREKVPCKLVSKTSLSHNVRLFRFALPSEKHLLGLPVGKHLFVSAIVNEKLCMRAYTPTSKAQQKGYFELLVKVYFKNVDPRFPSGGVMTQHLESLTIGDTVYIKGPLGHIEYTGLGKFKVHNKVKSAKKLAMIAAGTGITPIYAVMQAVLMNPEDETEIWVVCVNRKEEDVLLKEELDGWVAEHGDRVKVWHVIRQPKTHDWPYSVGALTEDLLRAHVPEWSEGVLALACGPAGLIQNVVHPGLTNMGYDTKESLLVF